MKKEHEVTTHGTHNIPKINYGSVRPRGTVHNAPALTEIAQDLRILKEIADGGTDKLSPFGHKLTSDSGKIDMMILNGCCTLSALSAVVGTSNTSKVSKISEQAKARRVRNHILHMYNTAGQSGKGITDRLKRVYGDQAREKSIELRRYLSGFAMYIAVTYLRQYGKRRVA